MDSNRLQSAMAKTLSAVQYEKDGEINVAMETKLEKRSSLDIDFNALPPNESPSAVQGHGINGENAVMEEDDGGWGRWEALLDVASIFLQDYHRDEAKLRRRSKRPMVDVEAVAPAQTPVLRSRRGREVRLPSRYKDSVVGAEAEEFLWGKSCTIRRKHRRVGSSSGHGEGGGVGG